MRQDATADLRARELRGLPSEAVGEIAQRFDECDPLGESWTLTARSLSRRNRDLFWIDLEGWSG